ncbi:hypothetical protein SAMN06295912_11196 [Sphingomonas laterariae]|uniref:Uncharacterized protein n=1 Tax=Edaphosphingomonas laterariae TaxID=861865 RepID=A0A239G9P7_9SPHN|nr:hypothetical protein [Sphingomonas laterariae]SNS65821.1 hypothetical protein SAMN06295912_11196 [Sphingomonas laterariae]
MMHSSTIRRRLVAASAAAAIALLAGCSGTSDEDAVVNDLNAAELVPDEVEAPVNVIEPVDEVPNIVEPAANQAAATPPPPPVEPDAQMIDDAEATGMTARVSRDYTAGNEATVQE